MKRIIIAVNFLIALQLQAQQPCVGTPGQLTWQVYRGLYDDEITEMLTWPDYPYHPYDTKILYNTKSEVNYDNYIGASIRGFIKVPQSDSVTFNITGNEQARFYLSTDSVPANKVLRAYLNAYTNAEEYTKYSTQTSAKIYLQAGVYYYFEILYVDGTGNDYANLWWKAPFVDINNWKPITAEFIYNVACLPAECPEKGTPCDDGNALTTDDREDGFCHCVGVKPTANTCVGERAKLENYRYDNITGSELNELYINPAFPAMPTYYEVLPLLGRPYSSTLTNNGRLTQAFLRVPLSGNYKFNVTGDDQTVFYLSSDDDPANKQAHQCLVSGYTNPTQNEKYQWQSTAFIYLDANQYYYVELNTKQATGGSHFGVFWQTPFGETGVWKRLPAEFLYNYDCTLACMPQGAACSDGNEFTNNDMYDNDCNCVGTPCTGVDCNSPIASYVPFDKCNVTDQIDNRTDNNWLSCKKVISPNPARDSAHWIKYDLGEVHRLFSSRIWNFNVANETQNGFQSVAVDVSEDGNTWTYFGSYTWPLASGEGNYAGFSGPDFQGLAGRYVLITCLDPGNACKGLGKVAFKAVYCPNEGTACNDNNPNTTNDKYNGDCICEGVQLLENLCEEDIMILGDSTLIPNNYSAIQYVQSMSQVVTNQRTSFIGGQYVELTPGFNSEEGAIFIAAIDTCSSTTANGSRIAARLAARQIKKPVDVPEKMLEVLQRTDSDIVDVAFYVPSKARVKLEILDEQLRVQHVLIDFDYPNMGHYTKRFRTKKLDAGLYTMAYHLNEQVYYEKWVVK